MSSFSPGNRENCNSSPPTENCHTHCDSPSSADEHFEDFDIEGFDKLLDELTQDTNSVKAEASDGKALPDGKKQNDLLLLPIKGPSSEKRQKSQPKRKDESELRKHLMMIKDKSALSDKQQNAGIGKRTLGYLNEELRLTGVDLGVPSLSIKTSILSTVVDTMEVIPEESSSTLMCPVSEDGSGVTPADVSVSIYRAPRISSVSTSHSSKSRSPAPDISLSYGDTISQKPRRRYINTLEDNLSSSPTESLDSPLDDSHDSSKLRPIARCKSAHPKARRASFGLLGSSRSHPLSPKEDAMQPKIVSPIITPSSPHDSPPQTRATSGTATPPDDISWKSHTTHASTRSSLAGFALFREGARGDSSRKNSRATTPVSITSSGNICSPTLEEDVSWKMPLSQPSTPASLASSGSVRSLLSTCEGETPSRKIKNYATSLESPISYESQRRHTPHPVSPLSLRSMEFHTTTEDSPTPISGRELNQLLKHIPTPSSDSIYSPSKTHLSNTSVEILNRTSVKNIRLPGRLLNRSKLTSKDSSTSSYSSAVRHLTPIVSKAARTPAKNSSSTNQTAVKTPAKLRKNNLSELKPSLDDNGSVQSNDSSWDSPLSENLQSCLPKRELLRSCEKFNAYVVKPPTSPENRSVHSSSSNWDTSVSENLQKSKLKPIVPETNKRIVGRTQKSSQKCKKIPSRSSEWDTSTESVQSSITNSKSAKMHKNVNFAPEKSLTSGACESTPACQSPWSPSSHGLAATPVSSVSDALVNDGVAKRKSSIPSGSGDSRASTRDSTLSESVAGNVSKPASSSSISSFRLHPSKTSCRRSCGSTHSLGSPKSEVTLSTSDHNCVSNKSSSESTVSAHSHARKSVTSVQCKSPYSISSTMEIMAPRASKHKSATTSPSVSPHKSDHLRGPPLKLGAADMGAGVPIESPVSYGMNNSSITPVSPKSTVSENVNDGLLAHASSLGTGLSFCDTDTHFIESSETEDPSPVTPTYLVVSGTVYSGMLSPEVADLSNITHSRVSTPVSSTDSEECNSRTYTISECGQIEMDDLLSPTQLSLASFEARHSREQTPLPFENMNLHVSSEFGNDAQLTNLIEVAGSKNVICVESATSKDVPTILHSCTQGTGTEFVCVNRDHLANTQLSEGTFTLFEENEHANNPPSILANDESPARRERFLESTIVSKICGYQGSSPSKQAVSDTIPSQALPAESVALYTRAATLSVEQTLESTWSDGQLHMQIVPTDSPEVVPGKDSSEFIDSDTAAQIFKLQFEVSGTLSETPVIEDVEAIPIIPPSRTKFSLMSDRQNSSSPIQVFGEAQENLLRISSQKTIQGKEWESSRTLTLDRTSELTLKEYILNTTATGSVDKVRNTTQSGNESGENETKSLEPSASEGVNSLEQTPVMALNIRDMNGCSMSFEDGNSVMDNSSRESALLACPNLVQVQLDEKCKEVSTGVNELCILTDSNSSASPSMTAVNKIAFPRHLALIVNDTSLTDSSVPHVTKTLPKTKLDSSLLFVPTYPSPMQTEISNTFKKKYVTECVPVISNVTKPQHKTTEYSNDFSKAFLGDNARRNVCCKPTFEEQIHVEQPTNVISECTLLGNDTMVDSLLPPKDEHEVTRSCKSSSTNESYSHIPTPLTGLSIVVLNTANGRSSENRLQHSHLTTETNLVAFENEDAYNIFHADENYSTSMQTEVSGYHCHIQRANTPKSSQSSRSMKSSKSTISSEGNDTTQIQTKAKYMSMSKAGKLRENCDSSIETLNLESHLPSPRTMSQFYELPMYSKGTPESRSSDVFDVMTEVTGSLLVTQAQQLLRDIQDTLPGDTKIQMESESPTLEMKSEKACSQNQLIETNQNSNSLRLTSQSGVSPSFPESEISITSSALSSTKSSDLTSCSCPPVKEDREYIMGSDTQFSVLANREQVFDATHMIPNIHLVIPVQEGLVEKGKLTQVMVRVPPSDMYDRDYDLDSSVTEDASRNTEESSRIIGQSSGEVVGDISLSRMPSPDNTPRRSVSRVSTESRECSTYLKSTPRSQASDHEAKRSDQTSDVRRSYRETSPGAETIIYPLEAAIEDRERKSIGLHLCSPVQDECGTLHRKECSPPPDTGKTMQMPVKSSINSHIASSRIQDVGRTKDVTGCRPLTPDNAGLNQQLNSLPNFNTFTETHRMSKAKLTVNIPRSEIEASESVAALDSLRTPRPNNVEKPIRSTSRELSTASLEMQTTFTSSKLSHDSLPSDMMECVQPTTSEKDDFMKSNSDGAMARRLADDLSNPTTCHSETPDRKSETCTPHQDRTAQQGKVIHAIHTPNTLSMPIFKAMDQIVSIHSTIPQHDNQIPTKQSNGSSIFANRIHELVTACSETPAQKVEDTQYTERSNLSSPLFDGKDQSTRSRAVSSYQNAEDAPHKECSSSSSQVLGEMNQLPRSRSITPAQKEDTQYTECSSPTSLVAAEMIQLPRSRSETPPQKEDNQHTECSSLSSHVFEGMRQLLRSRSITPAQKVGDTQHTLWSNRSSPLLSGVERSTTSRSVTPLNSQDTQLNDWSKLSSAISDKVSQLSRFCSVAPAQEAEDTHLTDWSNLSSPVFDEDNQLPRSRSATPAQKMEDIQTTEFSILRLPVFDKTQAYRPEAPAQEVEDTQQTDWNNPSSPFFDAVHRLPGSRSVTSQIIDVQLTKPDNQSSPVLNSMHLMVLGGCCTTSSEEVMDTLQPERSNQGDKIDQFAESLLGTPGKMEDTQPNVSFNISSLVSEGIGQFSECLSATSNQNEHETQQTGWNNLHSLVNDGVEQLPKTLSITLAQSEEHIQKPEWSQPVFDGVFPSSTSPSVTHALNEEDTLLTEWSNKAVVASDEINQFSKSLSVTPREIEDNQQGKCSNTSSPTFYSVYQLPRSRPAQKVKDTKQADWSNQSLLVFKNVDTTQTFPSGTPSQNILEISYDTNRITKQPSYLLKTMIDSTCPVYLSAMPSTGTSQMTSNEDGISHSFAPSLDGVISSSQLSSPEFKNIKQYCMETKHYSKCSHLPLQSHTLPTRESFVPSENCESHIVTAPIVGEIQPNGTSADGRENIKKNDDSSTTVLNLSVYTDLVEWSSKYSSIFHMSSGLTNELREIQSTESENENSHGMVEIVDQVTRTSSHEYGNVETARPSGSESSTAIEYDSINSSKSPVEISHLKDNGSLCNTNSNIKMVHTFTSLGNSVSYCQDNDNFHNMSALLSDRSVTLEETVSDKQDGDQNCKGLMERQSILSFQSKSSSLKSRKPKQPAMSLVSYENPDSRVTADNRVTSRPNSGTSTITSIKSHQTSESSAITPRSCTSEEEPKQTLEVSENIEIQKEISVVEKLMCRIDTSLITRESNTVRFGSVIPTLQVLVDIGQTGQSKTSPPFDVVSELTQSPVISSSISGSANDSRKSTLESIVTSQRPNSGKSSTSSGTRNSCNYSKLTPQSNPENMMATSAEGSEISESNITTPRVIDAASSKHVNQVVDGKSSEDYAMKDVIDSCVSTSEFLVKPDNINYHGPSNITIQAVECSKVINESRGFYETVNMSRQASTAKNGKYENVTCSIPRTVPHNQTNRGVDDESTSADAHYMASEEILVESLGTVHGFSPAVLPSTNAISNRPPENLSAMCEVENHHGMILAVGELSRSEDVVDKHPVEHSPGHSSCASTTMPSGIQGSSNFFTLTPGLQCTRKDSDFIAMPDSENTHVETSSEYSTVMSRLLSPVLDEDAESVRCYPRTLNISDRKTPHHNPPTLDYIPYSCPRTADDIVPFPQPKSRASTNTSTETWQSSKMLNFSPDWPRQDLHAGEYVSVSDSENPEIETSAIDKWVMSCIPSQIIDGNDSVIFNSRSPSLTSGSDTPHLRACTTNNITLSPATTADRLIKSPRSKSRTSSERSSETKKSANWLRLAPTLQHTGKGRRESSSVSGSEKSHVATSAVTTRFPTPLIGEDDATTSFHSRTLSVSSCDEIPYTISHPVEIFFSPTTIPDKAGNSSRSMCGASSSKSNDTRSSKVSKLAPDALTPEKDTDYHDIDTHASIVVDGEFEAKACCKSPLAKVCTESPCNVSNTRNNVHQTHPMTPDDEVNNRPKSRSSSNTSKIRDSSNVLTLTPNFQSRENNVKECVLASQTKNLCTETMSTEFKCGSFDMVDAEGKINGLSALTSDITASSSRPYSQESTNATSESQKSSKSCKLELDSHVSGREKRLSRMPSQMPKSFTEILPSTCGVRTPDVNKQSELTRSRSSSGSSRLLSPTKTKGKPKNSPSKEIKMNAEISNSIMTHTLDEVSQSRALIQLQKECSQRSSSRSSTASSIKKQRRSKAMKLTVNVSASEKDGDGSVMLSSETPKPQTAPHLEYKSTPHGLQNIILNSEFESSPPSESSIEQRRRPTTTLEVVHHLSCPLDSPILKSDTTNLFAESPLEKTDVSSHVVVSSVKDRTPKYIVTSPRSDSRSSITSSDEELKISKSLKLRIALSGTENESSTALSHTSSCASAAASEHSCPRPRTPVPEVESDHEVLPPSFSFDTQTFSHESSCEVEAIDVDQPLTYLLPARKMRVFSLENIAASSQLEISLMRPAKQELPTSASSSGSGKRGNTRPLAMAKSLPLPESKSGRSCDTKYSTSASACACLSDDTRCSRSSTLSENSAKEIQRAHTRPCVTGGSAVEARASRATIEYLSPLASPVNSVHEETSVPCAENILSKTEIVFYRGIVSRVGQASSDVQSEEAKMPSEEVLPTDEGELAGREKIEKTDDVGVVKSQTRLEDKSENLSNVDKLSTLSWDQRVAEEDCHAKDAILTPVICPLSDVRFGKEAISEQVREIEALSPRPHIPYSVIVEFENSRETDVHVTRRPATSEYPFGVRRPDDETIVSARSHSENETSLKVEMRIEHDSSVKYIPVPGATSAVLHAPESTKKEYDQSSAEEFKVSKTTEEFDKVKCIASRDKAGKDHVKCPLLSHRGTDPGDGTPTKTLYRGAATSSSSSSYGLLSLRKVSTSSVESSRRTIHSFSRATSSSAETARASEAGPSRRRQPRVRSPRTRVRSVTASEESTEPEYSDRSTRACEEPSADTTAATTSTSSCSSSAPSRHHHSSHKSWSRRETDAPSVSHLADETTAAVSELKGGVSASATLMASVGATELVGPCDSPSSGGALSKASKSTSKRSYRLRRHARTVGSRSSVAATDASDAPRKCFSEPMPSLAKESKSISTKLSLSKSRGDADEAADFFDAYRNRDMYGVVRMEKLYSGSSITETPSSMLEPLLQGDRAATLAAIGRLKAGELPDLQKIPSMMGMRLPIRRSSPYGSPFRHMPYYGHLTAASHVAAARAAGDGAVVSAQRPSVRRRHRRLGWLRHCVVGLGEVLHTVFTQCCE